MGVLLIDSPQDILKLAYAGFFNVQRKTRHHLVTEFFCISRTGNDTLQEQSVDLLTDQTCQKPSPAIVATIGKG